MPADLLLVMGSDPARTRAAMARVNAGTGGAVPRSGSRGAVQIVVCGDEGSALFDGLRDRPGHGLEAWIVLHRDTAAALEEGRTEAAGPGGLCRAGAEHGGVHVTIGDGGDRVLLETDGVGVLPVYCGEGQGGVTVLSTKVDWVARALDCVQWHEQAVLEYLAYLHPLENRTLLKDVSILPAGVRLEWRADTGTRVQSAPLFLYPGRNERRPLADGEGVEAFRGAWDECMRAVRDRYRTPLLSLSGGLDSRAIAAGLSREAGDLHCVTFGSPDVYEVQCAAAVAKALGQPHKVLPADGSRFPEDDAFADLAGGVNNIFDAYPLWFRPEMEGMGDVFIQGITGDIFWGSDGFGPYFRRADQVESAMAHDLEKGGAAAARRLTVPDVHGTLARRLRDGLASSLAPFAHMHPADAATNWNVVIRQRRWGFTVGQVLRQRGVAYENPFFYRPFLEFAKHLGPRSRTGGHLYLNVHQRVFERTADLPRSNDGRSPNEITDQLYARRGSIWQRVMNRLNAEVARRQASRCPGRVPVYNHRQWLMSDTLFRRRYIELLEQASAGLPAILAPEKFGAALDSLARHEVDFDPVELGRGICLALWGQKWGGAGGLP